MAKVKKMADGGIIAGLGSMVRPGDTPSFSPAGELTPKFGAMPPGGGDGGGGGGGSASDGLGQIHQGAGTVAGAISRASNALGGGGGGGGSFPTAAYKKGGSAKKHSSGGKISLKDCSVSTASKGKNNSNW